MRWGLQGLGVAGLGLNGMGVAVGVAELGLNGVGVAGVRSCGTRALWVGGCGG